MHGLVTVIPVSSVESGTPSAWVRSRVAMTMNLVPHIWPEKLKPNSYGSSRKHRSQRLIDLRMRERASVQVYSSLAVLPTISHMSQARPASYTALTQISAPGYRWETGRQEHPQGGPQGGTEHASTMEPHHERETPLPFVPPRSGAQTRRCKTERGAESKVGDGGYPNKSPNTYSNLGLD